MYLTMRYLDELIENYYRSTQATLFANGNNGTRLCYNSTVYSYFVNGFL